MSFQKSPALKVFKKLVNKISGIPFYLRTNKKKKWLEVGKPGEIIEKLSAEERELIQQLTSEEVQNASPDFGHIDYICDEYWEKKSREDQIKEYLNGTKLKK